MSIQNVPSGTRSAEFHAPQGTGQVNFGTLLASGKSCEERFNDWERGMVGFSDRLETGRRGIEEDMQLARSPNVPPHIRVDAMSSALGRTADLRRGINEQAEAIDKLLRDCGDQLTDRQKQRVSDIRGQLAKENERLGGLEMNMQAGRALLQAGRAADAVLDGIGNVVRNIGSWIPPIPMPLPPLFERY